MAVSKFQGPNWERVFFKDKFIKNPESKNNGILCTNMIQLKFEKRKNAYEKITKKIMTEI